ncbi:MAG: AtpZ/AtpI family protein [Nitrospiraceae bacterium]|jgi:ATP synthase protein I|nr:MAG: AtpZ/AtpI family protein [Nitrospiraceae bacterium]
MPEKPFFRQLLQASTIGLNLVFSTFIGLAIGYGLDSLFHTSPWLTIIFLLIGIIAGFRELLRIAKKQDNGSDTKNT